MVAMRVDVRGLQDALSSTIRTTESALNAAGAQEGALMRVASDANACDSQAYGRMRDYLSRVRLPALRVQQDFLLTFESDVRNDQTHLAALNPDASGAVDTDLVQGRIESRERTIRDLRTWQGAYGGLIPGIGDCVEWMCEGYRNEIVQLRQVLYETYAYAEDASIYAASEAAATRLGQAQQSLSAVSFDRASAAFDLSRIGDLSWVGGRDEAYWRRHDKLVLERWFVFDEDGNVSGVRPEAAGELGHLLELGLGFIGGSENLSESIEGLAPDDRYLLAWLIAKLGDPVMEAGSRLAGFIQGACPGLVPGVTNLLSAAAKGGPLPWLSDSASFTFAGGQVQAINVPGSIQNRSGFSDLIDMASPFIGADIDTSVCTFAYGDKEYRLQTWDGTYGWGLYHGGEIGFYERPLSTAQAQPSSQRDVEQWKDRIDSLSESEVDELWATYDSASAADQPKMELWVRDENGQKVAHYDAGKTYWSFTASPETNDYKYTKEDLHIEGRLTFDDPGLATAAKHALAAQGVSVSQNGGALSVVWKR